MIMRKYKNYSDSDVIAFAKEVFSIAGLLKKLDLKMAGGNYAHIKKTIQRLNIDTSHWTGMAWSKDQQLKNWQNYTKVTHCKKHLIKLRGNTCESCNNSLWLNNSIPLEVHHLDSDRTNNNLNNLQLLCPNCHALTDSWRGRRNAGGGI